jgi:hypothetical protein
MSQTGASGSLCNPSYSGDRDQEDRSSKPAPGVVVYDCNPRRLKQQEFETSLGYIRSSKLVLAI